MLSYFELAKWLSNVVIERTAAERPGFDPATLGFPQSPTVSQSV